MKKFISAVLSAAIALSCVSVSVYAEAASSVYTIDATTKTIKNVAPLTKVSAFESNITGAEVDVVNVDGTSMADTAYATDNVFAKIDGEIYKIDVEYPYDPIQKYGRGYRADGDVLFEKASANFNSTVDGQAVLTNSGFAYATSGYKLGDASGAAPSLNSGARTLITKQSENGEPVYVIENNAPRYAFLRSHYSATSYETAAQSALTDITKGKVSVTTVTFKADKMGNVSLHHNAAGKATAFKGDGGMERFTYSGNATYIPNAIHFTEDGTIKIGGTYANGASATDRTPKHNTGVAWEAGKEYTVSVVQKLNDGDGRSAYVYGVYVNGEKIFPMGNEAKDSYSHFVYSSSKNAYSMTTRGSDYKYHGGISAVLIGAAPKTAGEDIKVSFSDVKVYALDSAADYDAKIDTEFALGNVADVTVSETDAKITDAVAETVASFKAKYPNVVVGIYNADGTMVADDSYLATGMKVMVATNDGVQGKTYALTATEPLNESEPEAMPETYTVNTETKTISGVIANTKVADFLAKFKNAELMEVINIDGSKMADTAYATENVSVKFVNGDIYEIAVSDFTPFKTYASALADDTVVYNKVASEVTNNVTVDSVDAGKTGTTYGFTKLQKYGKIGFGSDNLPEENTADQTVKGTKKTINGKTVYVMENDSNNYAYLRSHQTSSERYSTDLSSITATYDGVPVVTTVEFEADKLGNISVFNNVSMRKSDDSMVMGDSGIDALHYSTDLPYIPTSVHFLEDGSVKLGGMYAGDTATGYSSAIRSPKQETNFTWKPGEKYTVSVVQRYKRGSRDGWVDGVYVNGEKIFPNNKTISSPNNSSSVGLDGDSFKIRTRDSAKSYGGGVSSVMIGTAPKDANDNLTVYLSDVKVYRTAAYNPAADKDITLASGNPIVKVDNENATITCMGALSTSDITSDAKLKIEGNVLKAVSADGLLAKTYKIVTEDIMKGFYNGENGPEIDELADADNNVSFSACVEKDSIAVGTSPLVMLAVYSKTSKKMMDSIEATGVAYNDEITKYTASIDISEYDKSDLEFRGFIWNGAQGIAPISVMSELK